jgi:hypothetical protein
VLGAYFQETEWLECEADHSPSSSAKVKSEQTCTSTPVVCLHSMYRDNFVFTFFYYPVTFVFKTLHVEDKNTFICGRVIMNELALWATLW